MAVKKTGYRKKKSSGKVPARKVPVPVVLWILVFIVLITSIFIIFPSVKKSRENFSENRFQTPEKPPAGQAVPEIAQRPGRETPSGAEGQSAVPPVTPPETPEETKPAGPEAAETEKPAETPVEVTQQPPTVPPVETRDRSVYFMQLDRNGTILQPVKVNRKLGVSSSPLQDSLNALFAGPTAEEKRSGLDSFIPQNSRILSIQIRDNTAFISFNEEFQWNPLGSEGIAAQLKQIVWTATEFPNVHNVQILINGKKIDFISENINIENPIGRQ